MKNPFDKIYKQCKEEPLSEHPPLLLADIELTNYCNLQCTMCPVGRREIMRGKGCMDIHFFEDMLNRLDCAGVKAVRFVRWGEPTMHPEFTKFLGLAKEMGFLVHFNTNGMLWDEDLVHWIIVHKIDSVKFSFQGTNQYEYERIRRGAKWDTVCKWVKYLVKQRGDRYYPYIEVGCTNTKASDEQCESFRQYVGSGIDAVTFGKTKWIGSNPIRGNSGAGAYKAGWHCPEFSKVNVNWNGEVTFCCGDYDGYMLIGNLKKQSLQEIWNGETTQQYRRMLIEGRGAGHLLCGNCPHLFEI